MASSFQTLQDVFTDVRYLAGKDQFTLPQQDLLRIANKYFLLLFRELVDLNEDIYAEISWHDLEAGQREYPLPVDDITGNPENQQRYGGGLVKLQRVEITYDGQNWYVGNPLSLQEISGPTITDADLNAQFDKTSPRYWFKDRSVWIAPVPDVDDVTGIDTRGLYIYWIRRPGELVANTDIPEIPKDFLNVLCEGMLYDVYRKFGRMSESDRSKQMFEFGIEKMKFHEAHPDVEQPLIFMRVKNNYK